MKITGGKKECGDFISAYITMKTDAVCLNVHNQVILE